MYHKSKKRKINFFMWHLRRQYVLASGFGKFLANKLMNVDDWNNVKFYTLTLYHYVRYVVKVL